MRLAFVSPLPPAPTGVADYAADLLALVAGHHEIELFHAQDEVDARAAPRGRAAPPGRRASSSATGAGPSISPSTRWATARATTSSTTSSRACPGCWCSTTWCCTTRAPRSSWRRRRCGRGAPSPGRASRRASGRSPCSRRGARSSSYSYPAQGERLFAAQLGTVGDLLPYAYPLFRIPVEASRLVAVHNRFMAEAIREEVPGTEVACAPMPVSRVAVDPRAVSELRARLGFAASDLVVGVFGLLTPEKRPLAVARAVARAAARRTRDCACCSWARSPTRGASRPSSSGSACAGARSSPAGCRSPSWRRTSRPRTSWRTCATPPRARPRRRCCGCWRRDARRSCPTSSTRPTCRGDAVLRVDVADEEAALGAALAAAGRATPALRARARRTRRPPS